MSNFLPDLEIPEYKAACEFTGEVFPSRKAAEARVASLRLKGIQAYVQNGLEDNYEIVVRAGHSETRVLTADFKELGTGVYQATNPDWDSGSIWRVHSYAEDGSVMLSRCAEDEEDNLADDYMVESSLKGLACRTASFLVEGQVIDYVDPGNNIVSGTVKTLDHQAGGYWVNNHANLALDFIPFHTAEAEGLDNELDTEFANAGDMDEEQMDAQGVDSDKLLTDEGEFDGTDGLDNDQDDAMQLQASIDKLLTDEGEFDSAEGLDSDQDDIYYPVTGSLDEEGLDNEQDDALQLQAENEDELIDNLVDAAYDLDHEQDGDPKLPSTDLDNFSDTDLENGGEFEITAEHEDDEFQELQQLWEVDETLDEMIDEHEDMFDIG